MYDILELNKKLLTELREIAKELKIKRVEAFKKQDLIYKILDQQAIVASDVQSKPKDKPKEQANPRGKRSERSLQAERAAARGSLYLRSLVMLLCAICNQQSLCYPTLIRPHSL